MPRMTIKNFVLRMLHLPSLLLGFVSRRRTAPAPPEQLNLELDQISEAGCYEAGPTGFWLHRKLTALGVTNSPGH